MLSLPADCERWPEFQVFSGALAMLKLAPSMAWHAFGRLWVDLAYQAQLTGRPGLMTAQGCALYRRTLEHGDGMAVWNALVASGLLRQESVGPGGEEWFCGRFARLNEHLNPDAKRKELRGAAHSAIKRNERQIAANAAAQGLLLSATVFRHRDGRELTAQESQRAMVLIMTCDRALGKRARGQSEYTEGLMADAAHADKVLPADKDERYQFFFNLSDRREHPMLPKTTEQLLADIESVLRMLAS